MFLNKAVYTPFVCPAKLFVNRIKNAVSYNGQKNRVQNFRNDDPSQIKEKMDSSSDQKRKKVLAESVKKICRTDQKKRSLNIIIVENPIKISGKIANPQIDQRLKAKDVLIKEITAKTAEKAGEQSASFSSHQSEGYGENHQKIWPDGRNFYKGKHTALNKRTADN